MNRLDNKIYLSFSVHTLQSYVMIQTTNKDLMKTCLLCLNADLTRKCGNYSDVLPLKAARRDSINSEGG